MTLALKVMDKNNHVICEKSRESFVDLVCLREYEEGDRIVLESSDHNIHLNLQLDDALGASLVYMTDRIEYHIPFGEKRTNLSPKVFYGNKHYLYAEAAGEHQIKAYRNLALNPGDQSGNLTSYPHATANTETRGEPVFAARNAIDGVRANLSHGLWPYASWGINRREDAALRIDFGRTVCVDSVALYIRADFPHDSWWTQVTLSFSDGSAVDMPIAKSSRGQEVIFPTKKITWISMEKMIKADDPSPFPALAQIEVYGTELRG